MWSLFRHRSKELIGQSEYRKLLIALTIPYATGMIGMVIGLIFGATWYEQELTKSAITPPDWVYKPVWSILYVLMGIALFMIWTTRTYRDKTRAYGVYVLQLLLNFLWPIVFFGFHSTWGSFVVDVLLFFAILWNFYEFNKISSRASYLLLPYLGWVLCATAISISIALVN